jgi:hypothetical protein
MCPLAVAVAHTQPSVAILKLAIGISASTTAFTRIDAVLLQPREVTEPNRQRPFGTQWKLPRMPGNQ